MADQLIEQSTVAGGLAVDEAAVGDFMTSTRGRVLRALYEHAHCQRHHAVRPEFYKLGDGYVSGN